MNPERAEGTCQCVLSHPRYIEWANNTQDALLWISADPGCGKSVLARSLIDNELRNTPNHTICYFFFKDNGEQDELSTALCSFLHQLYSHQRQLIRHSVSPWEKTGGKWDKEISELWRILLDSTGCDDAHDVTCIFDAVDECRSVDRARLIKMLTEFYVQSSSPTSEKRQCKLKFLVTSRPYEDIEAGFQKSIEILPNIHLGGEDENEQISQEIDSVVRIRVDKLAADLNLGFQTSDQLKEKLLNMQHRTCLWLYLAIDGIRETFRISLRPNQAVIETLPSTVEDAYETILKRVPPAQVANTRRILQIVVGARRPLTIGEMAIALGVATSKLPIHLETARLNPSWLEKNI